MDDMNGVILYSYNCGSTKRFGTWGIHPFAAVLRGQRQETRPVSELWISEMIRILCDPSKLIGFVLRPPVEVAVCERG